jgi:hypothetical protein
MEFIRNEVCFPRSKNLNLHPTDMTCPWVPRTWGTQLWQQFERSEN